MTETKKEQRATSPSSPKTVTPLENRLARILTDFNHWLDDYGETSWDHQSFFTGPIGRRAKSLYYNKGLLGTAAVAPIIFCEAFLPDARRLFHHRIRLPIADAHYAMGFAFLYEVTGEHRFFDRALHFLDVLKTTRCPGFQEYCWGYPFDWVTRGGLMNRETPLVTTTPYAYEAFLQVYEFEPRPEWRDILASIARHIARDIKSFPTSERASSSSYTPFDKGGVINSAAYRGSLLVHASQMFTNREYLEIAERNVNFVLETQNEDGSWFYAMDGVRDFVDHFHTCFVMKGLAKIYRLTGDDRVQQALSRAVDYYMHNLFYADGMPKPFSRAPRLTVYKCELYDAAECINLCLLLRELFPVMNVTLENVAAKVLTNWVKADGSFRSRRLHLGWDNVPMHRWGQSQMFRSLAFYLREEGAKDAKIRDGRS